MLLVQSNSNLQAMKYLFPWGSINRQPTPAPSFELDPSKYKDQRPLFRSKYAAFGAGISSVTCEKWQISNYCYAPVIDEVSASKSPKKESAI